MSNEEKQIRKEIAKWQLDADYIDVSTHNNTQRETKRNAPRVTLADAHSLLFSTSAGDGC